MNEWVHNVGHSYFANEEGVVIREVFEMTNTDLWHACDYTSENKRAATCISRDHAIAWTEKE